MLSSVLILISLCLAAPKYQVLYSFTGMQDGGGAFGGLAFDKKGNLYSTTSGGGANGFGTVYRLKRQPDSRWTEKVLHSFSQNGAEGNDPFNGVTFNKSGSLYGTTQVGGANNHGAAFQMTKRGDGWTLDVLYAFCAQPGCADSGTAWGTLTLDTVGNIYGTGFNVYELSPSGDSWTETVLHDFCQKCNDGWQPFSGVILDAKGNLYGTTQSGGINGLGTVFKVRHMPDGSWKERVLHSFPNFSGDGAYPGLGHVIMDGAGNLYGTANAGGTHRCGNSTCGLVYELSPQPNGHWKETVLHVFKKVSTGYKPVGGVTMDLAGNLYGTTIGGGTQCDCGVIYKLAPNPDGSWTYTVLHNFSGTDGAQPEANLILDDQGNLYGTAFTGGPGGAGVVFELTP